MKSLLNHIHSFWFRPTDGRSYAYLRLAFAGLSLFNLWDFWFDRHFLLSNQGVFSANIFANAGNYWSLFFLNNQPMVVTSTMLLAMVASVGLGFRKTARLSAIYLFLWYTSFHNMALIALSGYDDTLSSFYLFFAISPLGSTKPSDAKTTNAPPIYGLWLFRWYICLVYIVALVAKIPDPFWQSGEHWAYFVMSVYSDISFRDVAQLINVSIFLTYGALIIEYALPFFLLFPRTTLFGIGLGTALHLGIWAISWGLWVFSWSMMLGYFAFLDHQHWLKLRPDKKPS